MSLAGNAITVGLLLTGSDVYDNTADFLLTGSDVTFVFYCFIIYFNLYFFVESSFALYILRRRHVHQYLQMLRLQFNCSYQELDPSK